MLYFYLAFAVLASLSLGLLLPVASHLFFAFIFFYFAKKPYEWMLRRHVNPNIAALGLVLSLIFILVLTALTVVPFFIDQALELLNNYEKIINYLIDLLDKSVFFLNSLIDNENPTFELDSKAYLLEASRFLVPKVNTLVSALLLSSSRFAKLLSFIVIAPIISYYFIISWNPALNYLSKVTPVKYATKIKKVFSDIDAVLSGFIIGQLSVCVILTILFFLAFIVVKLKYSLILALFIGITSIFPVIGSFMGIIVVLISVLFNYGVDWFFISYVVGIYTLIQVIDGNFITPNLVGSKVGLSPAIVIISLISGLNLAGIVGALVAVPIAGILKVLWLELLSFYISKEFNNDKVLENE